MPKFYSSRALLLCCLLILFTVIAFQPAPAQSNVTGQWTTLSAQMPINPGHLAMMHNGKVLVVSGNGAGAQTTPEAVIYDPVAQTVSAPTTLNWDMFCNGMVILPDGRPYIIGGFGFFKTAAYDPSAGTFTDLALTTYGRWYPLTLLTSFGNVIAISGIDNSNPANLSKNIEMFNGTSWLTAPVAPVWTPPLYPRGHVLGNGKIFIGAPQASSTIIDENTGQETLNVATTRFGGDRTYGTSVLLPLYPPNYAEKVMILGGGTSGASTNTTEFTSDLTQNQTNPTWTSGPTMSHQRVELNATILPTGKVLVYGGSTNDEDSTTAATQADLYDPGSNTFSAAASNHVARLYHSTGLLLPDATVVLMGSQPGLASNNPAFDHSIEIYQPAYLFNPDGSLATRPTITSAPANISYGAQFQIQTSNASSISSVVMIRAGTVTHAFNMEQRLIGLSFTAGSGVLTVTTPTDSVSTPTGLMNPAPPGYYMLFLVNSSGVPSVAQFVQLKSALTISPILQAANTSGNAGYTVTISDTNAFAGGCVTPSISGLPSGATSSAFNPTSICGTGSSSVTVTEAASTPSGSSTLTFTGTSGSISHRVTAAFTANVTPASAAVTFSGSEKNIPGTAGTATVTIGGPGDQPESDGAGGIFWDSGQVFILVPSSTGGYYVPYGGGSPCCGQFIAQYLVNGLNQTDTYVSAACQGGGCGTTIVLTARTTGSNTNYALSAGSTYDNTSSCYDLNTGNPLSPCFTQPSFTATASGPSLTGGTDTTYDTGPVSVTVNGHRDNCPNYGQGSTPSSIATNCANTINGDSGAPVTASASGSVLTLTAKNPGLIDNGFSVSVSISSSNGFSPPSFSASNPSSLSGGH